MKRTKVAVVGSRSYVDYKEFSESLEAILIDKSIDCDQVEFVSGGAVGVDSLAQKYAVDHGINIVNYLPEWSKFGRYAGIERNKKIVDDADLVIAFWDGKSKGTKSSINYANKKDKPCMVVRTGVKVGNVVAEEIPHFDKAV